MPKTANVVYDLNMNDLITILAAVLGIGLIAWKFYRDATLQKRAQRAWNRASAAYEEGDLGAACEGFGRVVRMVPTWAPGRRMFGRTLVQAGLNDDAEREFRMAAALDPKSAPAHVDLGLFLALNRRNQEEAVEVLEKAVSFDEKVRDELASVGELDILKANPRFRALMESR